MGKSLGFTAPPRNRLPPFTHPAPTCIRSGASASASIVGIGSISRIRRPTLIPDPSAKSTDSSPKEEAHPATQAMEEPLPVERPVAFEGLSTLHLEERDPRPSRHVEP